MIKPGSRQIFPFLALSVFGLDIETFKSIFKGIGYARTSGYKTCQYHADRGGLEYLSRVGAGIDRGDDMNNTSRRAIGDSAGHEHQFFYFFRQSTITENARIKVGKRPSGLGRYGIYDLEHPRHKATF